MPSVADVVVDGLRRAGTPRIFGGVAGGAAIEEAARAQRLAFVRAASGAAACIMAAVTGELTEAPGAVTLEVAEADAASGLSYARANRAPLIAVTESDRSRASVTSWLAPLVKASLGVEPESAAHRVAGASQLALTPPRGPVRLDLAATDAGRPAVPLAMSCRPAPLPYPDAAALDAAARAVAAAARPVLVAGRESRSVETTKWLRAFAEALPAPVLATPKARGVLPDPHPLALGLFPGGSVEADLLGRADLIVALGVDAGELGAHGWTVAAPVVHLAPSPVPVDHYRPVVEVVGEIGIVLEELAPRLRDRPRADWDVAALDRLKRRGAPAVAAGFTVARAVHVARQLTAAGTIAAVDGGAYRGSVIASWQAVAPGELLISDGVPTPGFALPAAIAAALVHPDRRAICFTDGDGLLAAVAELSTAARLALPIVLVAFVAPAGDAEPNLALVARSFGIEALVAASDEALRIAMVRALAAGAPALVEARTLDAAERRV